MLSTDLLGLVAINVLVLSYFLWRLRKIERFVARNSKRSLSLRKLAEVESTLTELSDAYDALLESHKKLRSRISMRQLREKRKNGTDVPDATTDPDGWKREMRLKLRQSGVLK